MNRELDKIPGVIWNFSQPISDNMEEAVSGVKGELAIKIYGDDLKTLEEKGDQIVSVMRTVTGSAGPGIVSGARPTQSELHGGSQAPRHAIRSMSRTCRMPSRPLSAATL